MLRDLRTSVRRRGSAPSSWAPALLSLAILLTPAAAFPFPRNDLQGVRLDALMPRDDCVQYCGYNDQYCCGSGQQCYTSNGIAGCRNTAAGGGYNLYTTTWTLTETFTSTYTSLFPAATTATTEACVPEEGTGQIACGSICCASWQYCAYEGQCAANAGAGGAGTTAAQTTATAAYTTTYTTGGVVVTTAYNPPDRVTATGTATETTGTALGATGTGGVVVTGTANSHLSGGAIAGIVIGTLAGVTLLIAICACVLVRGVWHSLLVCLGLRRRHHGEDVTIIEEERYRRHSGGRDHHGGWFGSRPAGPALSEKPKRSGAGWLGLGAALGTLLLLLGLRRKNHEDARRRPMRSRSDVGSGYYSGSYTSSDPSSRDTRRSRGTRGSHRTEATRVSRSSRPSRQSRTASRR